MDETKEKCKICEKDNIELTFVEKRDDQNFEGGLLCLDCLKNLDFYRELYETPKIATKICGKCGIESELIYVEAGDLPDFGPGFICSSCYDILSKKEK